MKSNNFDENDDLKLQTLSMVKNENHHHICDPTDDAKFHCLRFCRKFNILRLYPNHTTNKTLNLLGNENDSLYVNAHFSPTLDNCIYITNHLPCNCLLDDRSILEYITRSTELKREMNEISCFPKQQIWSYDGCSIEFINDLDIKNSKYPTLGMYLYNSSEQMENGLIERKRQYLSMFRTFLSCIESTFLKTNFLPYFIHPNRILYYKNDRLKLISSNLICFLFTPHNDGRRLRNALFSHPVTFFTREKKYNNAQKLLNKTMANIILDFFHSSFVTLLWIYLMGNLKNYYTLKRNGVLLLNNHNNHDDDESNNSKKEEERGDGKKKMKRRRLHLDDDDNNKKSLCKNDLGFCKNVYFNNNNDDEEDDDDGNDEKRKKKKGLYTEIHNYGCLHLLEIMPQIIIKAIQSAANDNNIIHLKDHIIKLFDIFKSFINQLEDTL